MAWHTALLRPDRVRAVAGLSVPYEPRVGGGLVGGAPSGPAPVEGMRRLIGNGFYMVYFQQPGIADEELSRDPRTTLRRLLYSASGDGNSWQIVIPEGKGFLDTVTEPDELPGWLTEDDLDVMAADFGNAGFTGALNLYRNIDRNWDLLRAWHGAPVLPPALYVVGDRDDVYTMTTATGADLTELVRASTPNLREVVVLPGCGHWTQQERPAEVNTALIDFLRSV
ncbi:alpha/beta hydrolase [Actinomadura sp. NPDC047616]|uniref:alpha/beta fold hydrolase n=1 Tax=Actinomadura sp. NPDC047616 TaxID=3155914 RepID=UPI0033EB7D8D